MIELAILKAFTTDKKIYQKYSKTLNTKYLKENFTYIYKIYNIINIIYSKYSNESISREELEASFIANYPVLRDQDRKELSTLLDRLYTTTISEDILQATFEIHRVRADAADLAILALSVNEGKTAPTKLLEACRAFGQVEGGAGIPPFVTDDLEALYQATAAVGGIRWPLECLNKSLGPLRKGNMGFVFARPEGGKTTFVAQVATYAVQHVDKPVIWFNNEQPGEEVKIRLYQAAFGITVQELFSNRQKYNELYKEKTKGLLFLLDDAILDRGTVETVLEQYQPSLVIFDQIDKILGFSDDRYDLELGQRYQWARELAKRYGPVIGVTQAAGSGENIRYLTMEHVSNARTAKQAEADWILGIGSSDADDFKLYRYFNISKNKLLGDEYTDPTLRHGQFQVIIEPEFARYRQID